MKTSSECIPCFLRQAKYAANLTSSDPHLQTAILNQVEDYLATLDMERSPPLNSIGLYNIITQVSGNPDPFANLKQQSNDLALALRPKIKMLIQQSESPFFAAILFAIAGNIIDYGSQQDFDLDNALHQCLKKHPLINDYAALRHDLSHAKTVLYLADNCGEIVFDSLFIDQLSAPVTIVVKSGPIINDATIDDATYCGLDKTYTVIANGTSCPGTPIGFCAKEFERLFTEADVIISKGQGNFETLSEVQRPIYHLLTIKCPVVGRHAAETKKYPGQIPTGAALLMRLGTKI
ncbi:MAG: ARMT1-like domain-containing protein [Desulfobulbaceae bacterium]|nr:ARMT1-like domain-containing protein [Desulfobulbaceae bacterium]